MWNPQIHEMGSKALKGKVSYRGTSQGSGSLRSAAPPEKTLTCLINGFPAWGLERVLTSQRRPAQPMREDA